MEFWFYVTLLLLIDAVNQEAPYSRRNRNCWTVPAKLWIQKLPRRNNVLDCEV